MGYFKLEISYFNSFWLKKAIYLGSKGIDNGSPGNSGLPYTYGDFNIPQKFRGGLGSIFPGLPWNPQDFLDRGVKFPSGCGSELQIAGSDGGTYGFDEVENWFMEASRYQEDFNANSTDYGAKAYLKEDFNTQEYRPNALIYSGIYNSRTGVNETNVFSVGESITRAADPQKGSIQKLYAEDTNLIIFQEDKVNKALIDKDQLYTSEGGSQTLPPGTVIGQLSPYAGEFGISKNPESFAVYGFRKYFADKDRGSILRLSDNGITEISENGMSNFFRDKLKKINETADAIDVRAVYGNISGPTAGFAPYITIASGVDIQLGSQLIINDVAFDIYVTAYTKNTGLSYVSLSSQPSFLNFNPDGSVPKVPSSAIPNNASLIFRSYERDKLIGGWDIHDREYVLSLQKSGNNTFAEIEIGNQGPLNYYTLAWDEGVLGWPTFYSYKPNNIFSLKNTFFTTTSSEIFEHYYALDTNNRNSFYGAAPVASSLTFVFNPQVSVNKNFLTIGYEGSNGWQASGYFSDSQGSQTASNYYNSSTNSGGYVNFADTTVTINSYYQGAYDSLGNSYPNPLTPPIYRSGFTLKEGKYVANLINNTTPRPGEVSFGNSVSGIKGYFATVTLTTDNATDLGSEKQIFAASSNVVKSSQ